MGRELKRVALDFNHPVGDIWPGFLNEHYKECPSDDCEAGATLDYRALELWVMMLLQLGESSRSGRRLHPYFSSSPVDRVGGKFHELTTALAGRQAQTPFGHDACDRWAATNKIIAAAGLPEDWGTCKACNGHSVHPDAYDAYAAWEKTEPPEGPGYQMWENVSEGSPISPVFETPEKLAEWLAENESDTGDYDAWFSMISTSGYAPSLVSFGGQVESGVQSLHGGKSDA